jgi:hypothetical protein
MLTQLNEVLGSSEAVKREYFYTMLHSGNNILSSVLYGASHGLHDMLYFMRPKYSRIKIVHTYESKLGGKCNTDVTVEGYHPEERLKSSESSNTTLMDFPSSKISLPKRGVSYERSMFTERNHKAIVSDLYTLEVKIPTLL